MCNRCQSHSIIEKPSNSWETLVHGTSHEDIFGNGRLEKDGVPRGRIGMRNEFVSIQCLLWST